jgi:hypothetical protein
MEKFKFILKANYNFKYKVIIDIIYIISKLILYIVDIRRHSSRKVRLRVFGFKPRILA